MNDSHIFRYFKQKDNNLFSKLDSIDRKDLIKLLNDYLIKYRKILDFSKDITFGFEIEVENDHDKLSNIKVDKFFAKDGWYYEGDSSLEFGTEVISPILIDNEKSWKDLKRVCSSISKTSSIDKHAGGHIHVGVQTLGSNYNSWMNFIRLWATYENIIFRFTNGEYLNSRPCIKDYAQPVSSEMWNASIEADSKDHYLSNILDLLYYMDEPAVCFDYVKSDFCDKKLYKNNIEFRCPNGTLDPTVWQNNTNLFINMLLYSKSTKFDEDIVNKRHMILENDYCKLLKYNQIYLDQVFEFVDMIFNNNIDKINFLRQYLKNMEIAPNNNDYYKAKKFTYTKY